MPHLLSDPSNTVYAILIVAVLVAVGVWFRKRNRASGITAVLFVGLFVAIFIIDRLVESPREEAVRKSHLIVEALNEQNWGKMSPNISDSFEYKQPGLTIKKNDMNGYINLAKIFSAELKSKPASAWDFNNDVRYDDATKTVEVEFNFKASELHMWHFKARFVKDPDGQFRMKDFQPYEFTNPSKETTLPVPSL